MLRAQKNASFNNGHRNQTTNIFYQKIFKSMDHSLAMNYFASLGIFMRQRHRPHRGNKITGNSYKFLERC